MLRIIARRIVMFVHHQTNHIHHTAHTPRFKRVFIGGHLTYFVTGAMHLPGHAIIMAVLAVLCVVELVAEFGGEG